MNPSLAPVRKKIVLLAGICLILTGALVYRFYVVQIVRHEELLKEAESRYTIREGKMRQRGRILDADGNLLVGSLPRIYVVCSPYSIVVEPFAHMEKSLKKGVRERIPARREKRRRMVADLLGEFFDGSADEFYNELDPWRETVDRHGKRIKVKRQHLVIAKAADPHQVNLFKAAMKEKKLHLGGFRFEDIYIRDYPKGRMLANLIGFANIGKGVNSELGGLERSIGETLRAKDSIQKIQQSGRGRWLAYGVNEVEEAGYDGDDIYLTVKEPIQAILEEELDAAQELRNASFVYAVIVDPRTGNILAMSQRPNFDPRDPESIKNGYFANALAGNAYEPGSVMKPFTVAKALDEGVITKDSIIDCGNSAVWSYYGARKRDPRGYGKMTPGGVLKKSSNIGTAKLALYMGEPMVYQMFKDFRFGELSGLPLGAESRGRLPRYPFPDKVTITSVPIGYSVQVTALQLARAYCALANGGKMPELRLLDRRRSGESGAVAKYPLAAPKQVFKNPDTAAKVTEMLVSVTDLDGTGKRARIPGFVVAGKTGTSQMVIGGSYDNAPYRASFCGYVPAYRPELVMVITFEGLDPKKDHGGGNVAAPVFQKTMSRVLKLLNVTPDFPDQLTKKGRR
ncbi:MAG: penicillin-binding protein 2 [Lentisphaerae bacterium]|nr:penicillin-binding protein 2 [Lentisphaerota bacterium]